MKRLSNIIDNWQNYLSYVVIFLKKCNFGIFTYFDSQIAGKDLFHNRKAQTPSRQTLDIPEY